MHKIKNFLLSFTAMTMLAMGSSQAATPGNTFVMAKDIADIITMDPAEVFELTTGEIIANIYDRVMMFEPEDLQRPWRRRSFTVWTETPIWRAISAGPRSSK